MLSEIRILFAVTVAVSAFLGLQGCSWEKQEAHKASGESVRVQIPEYTPDTGYRLKVVELFTLEEVSTLQGLAARFHLDPDARKGRLTGRRPEFRYIRDSQGVLIAKDDLSLQLVTLYSHFEKLRQLDRETGALGVLTYPRDVAVTLLSNLKGPNQELNNAMYSGLLDALVVQPYTKDSLPLMANAGVIGHEHFHSLFQKLVLNSLPVSSSDQDDEADIQARYHQVLLRGINEGLADVWGWIYSGDNGFVGRSLPQEKIRRNLMIIPSRFYPKGELLEAVRAHESQDTLVARAYMHGIQLARALRSFANLYSAQKHVPLEKVRPLMGQWIVATLPELQKRMASLKKDEYLSLSQIALMFSEQVKNLNSTECFYFGKLMPADDREPSAIVQKCRDLESLEKARP